MISTRDIVAAVRRVTGPGHIGLQEPSTETLVFQAGESNGYKYVDLLQAKLAQVCGTEQALVTSSGTAALHLALIVAGVEAYTEVLVPDLTFVGTANAVCYCGAIPNFVDVREYDLGINPFKLQRYLNTICEKRPGGTFNKRSGRKLSACIAVDLLGVPVAIDEIKVECGRWGIPVIEDAAQALGSVYKGRPCGSGAYIGILSFNKNKIVTTDGGGALLTDDPFIQAKAWNLATTARVAHPWQMNHTEVAYNYRMGNINAALGLPQLNRLDELVEQKINLHNAYRENVEVLFHPQLDDGSRCNYWLNMILLPPLDHRRDEILAALYSESIACRTLFTPLHLLPMFNKATRDNLEGAMDIWRRAICLPSSPKLGADL